MKNHSTAVIETSDLSFSYSGVPVLEKANLVVRDGDFLSIVGPNGGGKTTLLKLVLGLLNPTEGVVRVFGQSPLHARHRIGYMPQNPSFDVRFPVDVMDVVSMGLLGSGHGLGLFGKKDRRRVEESLTKLDISLLRNRPFSDLSGGQRQRVLIARALVSDPDLLILDEPTSNVDLAAERELFDVLKELNGRMTIVVVSHDVGFVSNYVKNVACVNRRIVVHPTSDITGAIISDIYGSEVRMVRHDEIGGGGRLRV